MSCARPAKLFPGPGRLTGLLVLWCLLTVACTGERAPGGRKEPTQAAGPRTVAPENRQRLDAAALLELVRPSIVIVEARDRHHNVTVTGSGVLVADNMLVTSWPLVSRAFEIRVRNDAEIRPATVEAVLDGAGLARLTAPWKAPVDLGRDTPPFLGDALHVVGATSASVIAGTEGKMSAIAGVPGTPFERLEFLAGLCVTQVGGGVFDTFGRLAGIVVTARNGGAKSAAAPVRLVKDLLALPKGSLPPVKASPLDRLAPADHRWVADFMSAVARDERPLEGPGGDRVNDLLDRLDPLVGLELERVREELGLGLLRHQRLFWEDAVEARTFGRAVKSSRRVTVERHLQALGVLTARDTAEADARMRAIAAREPFEYRGARLVATEPYLSQALVQVDRKILELENRLWAARSR